MKQKLRPLDVIAVVVACFCYVIVPFLATIGDLDEKRNEYNVVLDLEVSLASNHTLDDEDLTKEILRIFGSVIEESGAYFPKEWEGISGNSTTFRFVASFPQERDALEYQEHIRIVVETLEQELRQSDAFQSAEVDVSLSTFEEVFKPQVPSIFETSRLEMRPTTCAWLPSRTNLTLSDISQTETFEVNTEEGVSVLLMNNKFVSYADQSFAVSPADSMSFRVCAGTESNVTRRVHFSYAGKAQSMEVNVLDSVSIPPPPPLPSSFPSPPGVPQLPPPPLHPPPAQTSNLSTPTRLARRVLRLSPRPPPERVIPERRNTRPHRSLSTHPEQNRPR